MYIVKVTAEDIEGNSFVKNTEWTNKEFDRDARRLKRMSKILQASSQSYDNNWPESALIETTVSERYQGTFTADDRFFMNDLLPAPEYGVANITKIELLVIVDKHELL